MKILITGGLGFIGFHLAKRYLNECAKIYIVDNLSTNTISPQSEFILKNEKIKFIPMDLSNPSKNDSLLLEEILTEVSLVFHFASPVGVKHIDKNPKASVRSLFFTTSTLFPLFEKYNTKVIYASTSEVYGETDNAHETDSLNIGTPKKLRWGYACGKLMSEFMLHSYNFPFVILRFFNVTGPYQLPDFGMVMPTFIQNAQNNEDLIVHDRGTQVRSFCDIRDAVELIYRLAKNPKYEGEIFNIGNPSNSIDIKSLADLVIKKVQSSSRIVYKDFDQALSSSSSELYMRRLNTAKTEAIYRCQYSIDDIITSCIESRSRI